MADINEGLREGLWRILHDHKVYDEWSGVVLDIVSFATPIIEKQERERIAEEISGLYAVMNDDNEYKSKLLEYILHLKGDRTSKWQALKGESED